MVRPIGIGQQDFASLRKDDLFYIDKTHFIQEWWENHDSVTLITRPRRFGKTLLLSTVEHFFSTVYAGRGNELFDGLYIWREEKYRKLQGTWPVISLSFANVKEKNFELTRRKICQLLVNLYNQNRYLLEADIFSDKDRAFFDSISVDMGDVEATMAIYQLSDYLYRYYGKKVLILLDEYDTPMQEAYVEGFWDELSSFMRSMLNGAFKTNPYMERGILTGITRVSRESIFSDLNNLVVVTTTSDDYADCFGFTEPEVFAALEEYGRDAQKQDVKAWYDGFIFGNVKDIYNPWSILNFLKTGKLVAYWANTSSNSLIGKLLQEGPRSTKQTFLQLMQGEPLKTHLDEQVVYNLLDDDENAVWSLLLASGYLKVGAYLMEQTEEDEWTESYELEITNYEVKLMFRNMIRGWFNRAGADYNDFIKALLDDDKRAMNVYINRIAQEVFSYFDTGKRPSEKSEPERFYHGFVLGLMVELTGRYVITSNRESGFGRYDVMLEPKSLKDDAIIMEFKVYDPEEEQSLEETVHKALEQIDRLDYGSALKARGIREAHIRKYGFAFEGKRVLIG